MQSYRPRRSATYLFLGLLAGFLFAFSLRSDIDASEITAGVVASAEKLIGIEFTPVERDSMLGQLKDRLKEYHEVRQLSIPNQVPYALNFNPIPAGHTINKSNQKNRWGIPEEVKLPDDRGKLAYYTVAELSALIRQRKISSVELTRFFLKRLRKDAPKLKAVVTYTEQRALQRARQMDQELKNGKYRGPLHGIPYGIKDLFALEGYKTTWGAEPYKTQRIDQTATVIKKLDEAGAVLIAKLSLGALAYGDLWFKGRTRNPWNLEQGSSGSSAGSAAATAAGLVPFSLGTETLGSIISPSNRCGTTGLRPTFGRVSRHGAMALSWSMDKVGPITRTARDAALVFNAIRGPDGKDQTVMDLPFNYQDRIDMDTLRIGIYQSAFQSDYANKTNDQRTLKRLRQMGAELIPIELPDFPASSLRFILTAEAAAAFDKLTRTNRDTQITWQEKEAWPNTFRSARFIPAVEYIQANRARELLMRKMQAMFDQNEIDLYITPTFGGSNLITTNLTGHPSIVIPNGFAEDGTPTSISFVGKLFEEGTILEVAQDYQEVTNYNNTHPKRFLP